jgi:hypothetical protein
MPWPRTLGNWHKTLHAELKHIQQLPVKNPTKHQIVRALVVVIREAEKGAVCTFAEELQRGFITRFKGPNGILSRHLHGIAALQLCQVYQHTLANLAGFVALQEQDTLRIFHLQWDGQSVNGGIGIKALV